MNRCWMIIVVILFAACSTSTPQPTPDVDAMVAATVSAERVAFFQPSLLAPADSTTFDHPGEVTLRWEWVRTLDENEFFDVQVWKEGEPAFGITWTQDTAFALADWLSQQESGTFLWTIAVIEGNEGEVDALLGDAPPPQQFTLRSNTLPTSAPTAVPTPAPVVIENFIDVPDGFEAHVYAHLAQAPTSVTSIVFTPNGDLLALTLDGRLFQVRDDDDDGVAEQVTQLVSNDETSDINLVWAAGMALYDDKIYVSDKTRVSYLVDADDDGVFDQLHPVVEGLPNNDYPFHSNNGIGFDADGKLYVAVGSTTDHGPLRKDYEASIVRANADGSDFEVFATGFRNPFDLTIAPDGRVFANDNGPDRLDKVMPFYPPEELNYVQAGRDYGFPNVYGNGLTIRPHDVETESPVVAFPTSVVSSGLVYYAHDHFPADYQDGIFVAQFGGFNGQGQEIVFVTLQPTDDGGYTGDWNTFIPFTQEGRPVDVTVGPDGALYIVEWDNGYIFRVSYVGE